MQFWSAVLCWCQREAQKLHHLHPLVLQTIVGRPDKWLIFRGSWIGCFRVPDKSLVSYLIVVRAEGRCELGTPHSRFTSHVRRPLGQRFIHLTKWPGRIINHRSVNCHTVGTANNNFTNNWSILFRNVSCERQRAQYNACHMKIKLCIMYWILSFN